MLFNYTVRDKSGNITKGALEATNKNDVASKLMDEGFTPISIVPQKITGRSVLEKIERVRSKDKVTLSQELSTLINAGLPIAQSLRVLEKQASNQRLKKTLKYIAKDIEGGVALSVALSKHPKVFNNIYVNMVKAGEAGGILDKVLDRLSSQLEKEHEIKGKVIGAMIYPSIILIAMTGAVIILLITVIPQLSSLFDEFGGNLPLSTKILVAASKAITTYGIFTFFILAGFFYSLYFSIKKVPKIRKGFHGIILKIPVIGKLISKVNLARFSRTFASLLDSGIGVTESLEMIADSLENTIYKEETKKMTQSIKNGGGIGKSIDQCKHFPLIISQMVSVGEETGKVSDMLEKIARFQEREVDNIVKNLSSMIEPLLMIVLGVIIGFIVFAIITPIYQLTNLI